MDHFEVLERAWKWREKAGWFATTQGLRVFHGPGEGEGSLLKEISIDRFADHYWITTWDARAQSVLHQTVEYLKRKRAVSIVTLFRETNGQTGENQTLFGEPPPEGFLIHEDGAKYWIRFLNSKHPGLFLDHAPLRHWLRLNAQGTNVLNTFAYTGSLSVAAGLGGADRVVTLDLSNPTIEWAKKNWAANSLDPKKGDFLVGDYFEWVPRLKKSGSQFDLIILDPPSFSRGKKGTFSTSKDLVRLHEAALSVLAPHGVLVTSINSANVPLEKFAKDLLEAAKKQKRKVTVIREIQLPETFPTPLSSSPDRYLKGWILRVF